MAPHLVHVTVVHPRYDTRIFLKECVSLSESGAGTVTLLVADGLGNETLHGVRIEDVGRPTLGRAGRALAGNFRVWRALQRIKPELVHVHDPELLGVALLLRATGTTVVFDMHENLPKEILTKPWVSRPLRRLLSAVTRAFQLAACKYLPTVFAERSYEPDFPTAGEHAVVLNYPLIDTLVAVERPKHAIYTVGYIGGVSAERGAVVVASAVNHLRAGGADLGVLFVGSILPDAADDPAFVAGRHSGWLTCAGWRPPHEGWALIAECHVGVAVLQPSPNFVDSYPTKLFEYMALGLPVIVSDFPLWREIVESAGCGIVVDPTDPLALAAAIDHLRRDPAAAAHMAAAGRAAALAQFNWRSEFAKLHALYERILPPPALSQS